MSEDDNCGDEYNCNYKSKLRFWYGEQRVYHKTKVKHSSKTDLTTTHGSDEMISTDSDWDSQFPALNMKIHSTFTMTCNKTCEQENVKEAIERSGGDNKVKTSISCVQKFCLSFSLFIIRT